MNSAHIRRVIAAGMVGNALEWYDFAIYGYFAAQIGRHFFPHHDPVAQLLSVFGVFAIGYLMRPIGSVLVGHIGDRFGRRTALIFSVIAMAIAAPPSSVTNFRRFKSNCIRSLTGGDRTHQYIEFVRISQRV